MLIPLKHKYLIGGKGRYQGGERPAPRKHRDKIGREKHIALYGTPPVTVLYVDGGTGRGVFITT